MGVEEFEYEIRQKEKEISILEEVMDVEMKATDSELEAQALKRKIQLIDEELERVTARLLENTDKYQKTEVEVVENQRVIKTKDQTSQELEEKLELICAQNDEAKFIAEEADRKYEEVHRKLRMVEEDLCRLVEKADADECKCHDFEQNLAANTEEVKRMEDESCKNQDREDELEQEIKILKVNFKDSERRAEASERTVEKLESTIDGLESALYTEKLAYRDLSKKLDETMRDMCEVEGLDITTITSAKSSRRGSRANAFETFGNWR